MAILYKANETDFTHFGLGPLNDASSILVTEERNGIFELKMEYPVEGTAFRELKADRLIKADAGHNLKNQRFKIIRITKPLKGMVTVYAEHVSYLSQDLALKPKVTFTGTADVAIRAWKANLVDENPFIVSSDITTTASGSWTIDKVENPRRALGGVAGSLLDLYGGEYLFDNYQIRLWKQRGKNSTALIAYGRNLTDLTQEEEIASTYTSVYPYSVYQGEDGEETLLTLPELYLDSEHVGNYARRKILPIDFSQEEIKTEAALRSAAKTYIEANSVGVPKVNLKIKYIDLNKTLDYQNMAVLEEVNLCDHVPVYFEQFGINTTAKVVKVVWDDIQKRNDTVEIGEPRYSLTQAIESTVDGRVEEVEKKVNAVQVQADGIRLIYRQVERPPNGQHVGDLWYQPNGIYEKMYIWDGSDWKLVFDTADLEQVKREVDAAQATADQAKLDAIKAHDDAVLEASQYTDALRVEHENLMDSIQQEANAIKQTADKTAADINLAITAAGFTSLSDSLTGIKGLATTAETNAQKGIANAATALGQANTALTQVGAVSGKVTSVERNIDTINGTLSTKVNTTDFNLLKGTVTNQGTELTATKNALTAKADKTVVDTIAGRVTSTEGRLTVAENGIVLSATKTEVTNLIDGIQVGGRNLWIDSNTRNGYISGTGGFIAHPYAHKTMIRKQKILSNQTIIYQVWNPKNIVNTTNSNRVAFYTATDEFISRVDLPQLNGSDYQKLVFKSPPHAASVLLGIIDSEDGKSSDDSIKVKFETGDKATDWTPAPEDTDAKINSVSASLSVEADKIVSLLTRVTGTETSINQVKSTADSNKATISNHTGRISQVEQNVNGLQTTVANKAEQSQVTQLASSLSSLVTDFNNLETNGRNLLLETSTSKSITNSTTADRAYLFYDADAVRGRLITISVEYVKTEGTTGTNLMVMIGKTWQRLGEVNISDIPVGKPKRYTFTGTISPNENRGDVYFQSGTVISGAVTISKVKMEYGKNATYWTPAPEDVASQSQITQLSNSINLKVSKGEVSSQINIEAGRTLISTGKLILDANTYIMGTTFANDVKAKSLEAVDANIASIRAKILVANVVESTHIKADTALVNKLFATDLLVQTLTGKAAFINSVKAIDIAADRITTGTLNAANVNIINLNASSIATGTITGANSAWNLNTGLQMFRNPTTGDILNFTQGEIYFQKGANSRYLNYHDEGLILTPGVGNTGTGLNTSIHLRGGVNYIQFTNRQGTINYGRVEYQAGATRLLTNNTLEVMTVNGGIYQDIQANGYYTYDNSGNNNATRLIGNRLEIQNTEIAKNIYIRPSGTGSLVVSDHAESAFYNLVCKTLVQKSSRGIKTNIIPLPNGVLGAFNALQVVEYNLKQDLAMGIQERKIGFIYEDSPLIADHANKGIDISKVAAITVKAVQELNKKVDTFTTQHDLEIQKLKKRIAELEEEIA